MGTHVDNDGNVTFTGEGQGDPLAALAALSRELDQAFTAIADASVELADAETEAARAFHVREVRRAVAEWRACSERFAQAQRQVP